MAKKMVARNIPTKNYYMVLLVSVLLIILTIYVRNLYLSYRITRINDSVFADKSINQINTEDFNFTLSETSEAILYVSYTGSKEVYSMEKKLYRELKKKDLIEKVIYWNVTDVDQNDYLSILRSSFPDIKSQINAAPMLIYIKDGQGVEAMSSELKMIDSKVLDNLINKYEIE